MKGAFPNPFKSLLLCRFVKIFAALPSRFYLFVFYGGREPVTASLRACPSLCFAGLDHLQQSTTSVLAVRHQVLIIVRLALTAEGGLCPLRRQVWGHGWTEGPASPGGSAPSPGDWWRTVRRFSGSGKGCPPGHSLWSLCQQKELSWLVSDIMQMTNDSFAFHSAW